MQNRLVRSRGTTRYFVTCALGIGATENPKLSLLYVLKLWLDYCLSCHCVGFHCPDHQLLRLQWARKRRHWRAEWRNVMFSDESRFNMSYNDGRIRVRRYAGERNHSSATYNRGPTPSVMVWGAIGYNMHSRLLRIEGNVNSSRYIRQVLQPEVLHLLQVTPHAIFQQDNTGHTWQGLCKPSSKDDGYHCFPGLYVRHSCRPSNMCWIWLVGDFSVRVLQHLLLTLCGLEYKLHGGTFSRKISRASFIPCHDA